MKKYKKKLKTTGRQYIEDWATYKKSPEKSIDETWTEISTLARRIKETQPGYENLATESARIQSLLKCLPDEYSVIRDTLDVQDETNHEVVIQKLQEKEAALNRKANEATKAAETSKETAMYAKPRRHHRHHSSSSDASMPDAPRAPRNRNEKRREARETRPRTRACYICESSNHTARTCPWREQLRAYIKKKLARKKEKEKEERSKKDRKQTTHSPPKTVTPPTGPRTPISMPYSMISTRRNSLPTQRRWLVASRETNGSPTPAPPLQ